MGCARHGAERPNGARHSGVLLPRNHDRQRLTSDDRRSAVYRFDLPAGLIAQEPASVRDASRLMVVTGDAFADAAFRDLPDYLQAGDLLVLNETRVIAARLFGERVPSGGRVELLLLHPAQFARYRADATRWVALARPARRLLAGARIAFGAHGAATVTRVLDAGAREVEFALSVPFETFLARAGRLPLPPYVHTDSDEAQRRYQTVFARVPGSVAAPTASLHFTPELL
ncbi:MAG: S-adenosylmethionine:tRNA ribosyltransferase-isomerase, partial [Candidatus Tumulicola sp.]